MDGQRQEGRGDILVEGETIAAIDDDLGHLAETVDAVIDVSDSVVFPGLVDTHNHLWQAPVRGLGSDCWGREYFGVVHPLSVRYRPEDIYNATLGGAYELLTHGVTTVLDFCHSTNSPEHAAASVSALEQSGIRALFGFCFREREEAASRGFKSFEHRVSVLADLVGSRGSADLVGFAAALNNPDHVSPDEHAREILAARELGIISTLHSNLQQQVSQSDDQGLLGSDLLWVHAGAIVDAELDLLAKQGGIIVSTPQVEAANMGIIPIIGRALRKDVPVVFGTDVPAVLSGDMISQLRIGHALSRVTDAIAERHDGRTGARTPWHPMVDSLKLLHMATIGAANALGLDDRIGSLSVGKRADLVVMGTGPFGLGAVRTAADYVMFQSSSRDIELVMVNGQRRYESGHLVGIDTGEIRRQLDHTRDYVLGRAGTDFAPLSDEDRAEYERNQGKVTSAASRAL